MDTIRKGKCYSTITVAVPYELKEEATKCGLNLTHACVEGLKTAISDIKKQGTPGTFTRIFTESDPDVKV